MDHSYHYFKIAHTILFSVILSTFCLCETCTAQIEEEIQILHLFYEERALVVSTTRHPKPLSQVAENITVITAQKIREMNAHSVAEVLNRVTGLFVSFNRDFGAASLIHIQGSEPRHVLVLVDGISWNFLSEGSAETNSIPVEIIDRIEIIKGPASSAWGSSLGGVINIITKAAGDGELPNGSIYASYGENDTQDYRAQVAGKAGPAGYYLFAGHQASDGLRSSRDFDNTSLYSKFNVSLASNVNMGLSIGYSEPHNNFGDFLSRDFSSSGDSRTFFGTASIDALITPDLSMNVSLYAFEQKFDQESKVLGLGMIGSPGELLKENIYDEKTIGGRANLVWAAGRHTVVAGLDVERGELDQTVYAGSFYQAFGAPAISRTNPDIERWALYLNDTIAFDRWTLTPGIRYDYNDISGSFISPSLGMTCKVGDDSILRGSVARGFTIPPLSWTSGGGLLLEPNPSLDPEEVWSWQAGMESTAAKYLWVKATLFYHELDNALIAEWRATEPPTRMFFNNAKVKRKGIELETETVPIHNFSLAAGVAYVDIHPVNESDDDEIYSCNLGLKYDDRKSFRAELFGHYLWWNEEASDNGKYDDFIWDLNLSTKIHATQKTVTEFFLSAHNLFNGSQYLIGDSKNPERWIEAGFRFKF